MALDQFQRLAAESRSHIQLVLAGPGSGKTSTLVRRFANLVDDGVDPMRICAVTFTRKAADEMRRRIGYELRIEGRRLDALAISTFHSFCNSRVISRFPQACGVRPGYKIWMLPDLKRGLMQAGMFWNEDVPIWEIISGAKERLIDLRAFEEFAAQSALNRKAAPFFRLYEEMKTEAGALDMSDLIARSVAVLQNDEQIAQSVIGRFDYLLVDEFQDVNPAQVALIDTFVARGVSLWAVGDDDQMLYGFRAADVKFVLGFKDRYPDAQIHTLGTNYRAPKLLVDRAKDLIAYNEARYPKDYGSNEEADTAPGEIVVRRYGAPEEEAAEVAAAISKLLDSGVKPGKIAVLYRVSDVGLAMQSSVMACGVPYEIRGATDLWSGYRARLVLGTFYCLRDGETDQAKWYLGASWRARAVMREARLVRSARTAQGRVIANQTALWMQVKRILEPLAGSKACLREATEWRLQIETILTAVADCASVEDIGRRMKDQSRNLRVPPKEAVVFSTIHAAKGLEFDYVFLAGMEDNVCPHDLNKDIEEERRVAYVGVTRARRGLAVTCVRFRGGNEAVPSRFIYELIGEAGLSPDQFEFEENNGVGVGGIGVLEKVEVGAEGRIDVDLEVGSEEDQPRGIVFAVAARVATEIGR